MIAVFKSTLKSWRSTVESNNTLPLTIYYTYNIYSNWVLNQWGQFVAVAIFVSIYSNTSTVVSSVSLFLYPNKWPFAQWSTFTLNVIGMSSCFYFIFYTFDDIKSLRICASKRTRRQVIQINIKLLSFFFAIVIFATRHYII